MLLKFLFGSARVLVEGSDKETLGDVLLMTRKTDIFQHSDMKQVTRTSPSTGGFVKHLRAPEKMEFFGESVSCRVQTDESMNPIYAELVKTGSWWKNEHLIHNTVHTIFLVTKAGHKPSCTWADLKWEPTTHADMYEIVKAEDSVSNGW